MTTVANWSAHIAPRCEAHSSHLLLLLTLNGSHLQGFVHWWLLLQLQLLLLIAIFVTFGVHGCPLHLLVARAICVG